jgi:hypothetical protein
MNGVRSKVNRQRVAVPSAALGAELALDRHVCALFHVQTQIDTACH